MFFFKKREKKKTREEILINYYLNRERKQREMFLKAEKMRKSLTALQK